MILKLSVAPFLVKQILMPVELSFARIYIRVCYIVSKIIGLISMGGLLNLMTEPYKEKSSEISEQVFVK